MKLSILILAAGNSSRLGQPKQLVKFKEKTLIEFVAETALKISDEVLVVLGANSEIIEEQLTSLSDSISTVYNPDWQEGMGTSIRLGIQILEKKSDTVIILLSDQPFISQELLQKMVQTFAKNQKPIVSCVYNGQLGVPMLFDKSIFPSLLTLKGGKGAKSILTYFENQISTIDFKEGIIDIDTPEDLKNLQIIDGGYAF
jgi:molybdenum cofactor cytidylyltransferase